MATASVTNTFSNGTTADATQVNQNFTDIVNFLNANVVHKDGAIAMTGALAMGSQKITGLATPTATGDAATKGYVDAMISIANFADLTTHTPSASWTTYHSFTFTKPAGWTTFSLYVVNSILLVGSSATWHDSAFRVQFDGVTIRDFNTAHNALSSGSFTMMGGANGYTANVTIRNQSLSSTTILQAKESEWTVLGIRTA